MSEITYTVTGESKTRPGDLPDGLEIKELRRPITLTIATLSGPVTVYLKERGVLVNHLLQLKDQDKPKIGVSLNDGQLRELRDGIDRILGDTPQIGDMVRLRFEDNNSVIGPLYESLTGDRCVKGYMADYQGRTVERVRDVQA